jgi:hypothetical protein
MDLTDADHRPSPAGEGLQLVRKKLHTQGHVVLSDHELGLGPEVREHILREYFNERVLKRYPGDIPADRERARDVVRYTWDGDRLSLEEFDEVAIENRGGRVERREFEKTPVLGDPLFTRWIRAALAMIPLEARRSEGTFGINLFRTFTNVVTRPHQDGEEFIFVYVVDKVGTGAETALYKEKTDDAPLLRQTLEPGEMIVFKDSDFFHTATPLNPGPDGRAHRDALVCTVDY